MPENGCFCHNLWGRIRLTSMTHQIHGKVIHYRSWDDRAVNQVIVGLRSLAAIRYHCGCEVEERQHPPPLSSIFYEVFV